MSRSEMPRGVGALEGAFSRLAQEGRLGLAAFLPVGYPSLEESLRLVPALVAGGADLVELGIPFSDPLADGASIQRASYRALQQGVTPAHCLEAVGRLRRGGLAVPLILMGYYNTILAFGLEGFVREAGEAGADGLIVVDLPAEEAGPLREACLGRGVAFIPLLAPTSSDGRIAAAAAIASGFLYCVSLTGVTGAREALPPGLAEFIGRVRRHTPLPLAVGFGISRREHLEQVGRLAEAAVVGSALIEVIEGAPAHQRAAQVRAFLAALAGRRGTPGDRRSRGEAPQPGEMSASHR